MCCEGMMSMTQPTRAPLAVVTGASSGIGRELAGEYARNGFDLLIAAENDGVTDAARHLERQGATVAKLADIGWE